VAVVVDVVIIVVVVVVVVVGILTDIHLDRQEFRE